MKDNKEKTNEEASKLFHDIIKTSVSKKATTTKEKKKPNKGK